MKFECKCGAVIEAPSNAIATVWAWERAILNHQKLCLDMKLAGKKK